MKFSISLLVGLQLNLSHASLILNEIAYSGSADQCGGKDWIELVNQGPSAINLFNFILHDDKGKDDEDAKVLPDITLAENEFHVLCKGIDFEFGVGSKDSITLLDDSGSILSSVTLPGRMSGEGEDLTYAFFTDIGSYRYTATPTPGTTNVYTEAKSLEQVLQEQNEAGKDFFLDNMEPDGSSALFDTVVDIYINLDEADLTSMEDHPTHEKYVIFNEISVRNANNDTVIANGGKGKIRTKGQSTLTIPACLGLNVPYQIKFDFPFYGIEVAYLRNHFFDASYMRDYASHVMLKKFGLPHLRSRPAQLFLNDEYIGFYTLIEAPDQAYIMHRSFGPFDPALTALFKVKTMVADCPFTDSTELEPFTNVTKLLEDAKKREVPDPYYFERGDHRADFPANANLEQCVEFFSEELRKEKADMIKGYMEYNETCGLAMVKLGRVDRDFGPKSIEEAMIKFLETTFYNKSITDMKGSIDTDQWIKNLASYAVTINLDSVMTIVNNWYLATTSGGANDWRIVQWDHNNIASREFAEILCSAACGPRMIYWPILRPTCGAVEDHIILGRILNDESSMQTYLAYVEEFVGVLESGLLDHLRSYSDDIKEFIVDDPLKNYGPLAFGANIGDNRNIQSPSLLEILDARIVQVKAQLAAIKAGTLPRNGVYGKNEICPDWRDTDGSDYNAGSTVVAATTCTLPNCTEFAPCYKNSPLTCDGENRELIIGACQPASPLCDSCFPYSRCGAYNDNSGEYVESDECGSSPSMMSNNFSDCKDSAICFDHRAGICAFDGEILLTEGSRCGDAVKICKACFPNSRCGGSMLSPIVSSTLTCYARKFILSLATIVTLALIYY